MKWIMEDVERLHSSVSALKDQLRVEEQTLSLNDLLQRWWRLRAEYDALDMVRKRLYFALDRLNKQVLPKKFEDAGFASVRIPEMGRSFYPLTKLTASIPDKEKGYEWLKQVGGEDLITKTVNAGSLAAFVKSLIEDTGEEPPEDAVRTNTYTIIGTAKYTHRS